MQKPKWNTWERLSGGAVPALAIDARPIAFSNLKLDRSPTGRPLAIDLGFTHVSLADDDHAAIFRAMDGRRTIGELARCCEVPAERAHALIESWFDHGVVREGGELAIDGRRFHLHVQHVIRRGDFQRTRGELFAELVARPTRELVMIFLLQAYHWTNAANLHISAAIHHAATERQQMILVEFLGEEYWHGQWLRRGLIAAGMTEREIHEAVPLPAIVAHINLATQAAIHSTLAYAAIVTGTEGSPPEKTTAHGSVFDAIIAAEVVPPLAVSPFRAHAQADQAYGHDSVGAELFAGAGAIGRAEQDRIYQWLFAYLNNRNEINRGMYRAYIDRDAHVASVV